MLFGGCERPPGPPPPTTRPSPSESEVPAAGEQTAVVPEAAAPATTCSGHGLARLPCDADTLCADIDTDNDTVSLAEFVCVARTAASRQGPLRVGDVLRRLPPTFRKGFTLKHGTKQSGLRGHPQEVMADVVSDALAKRSQSADLDFPRVIMWDDTTGFTISYNGGLTASEDGSRSQTGADRLDLMGWNAQRKTFELWAVDLPVTERGPDEAWALAPYQPTAQDDNCTHCHGPDSRPIWPMYPDWPGFYGSDNDELTTDSPHQQTEREFLAYFRACVAPGATEATPGFDCSGPRKAAATRAGSPRTEDLIDQRRRYDTLFADDMAEDYAARLAAIDAAAVRDYILGLDDQYSARLVSRIRTPNALAAVQGQPEDLAQWLGLQLHPTWPYRPNHNEHSTEPSRAFFHRPNLRLGVLYNRLTALSVFEKIRQHPTYRDFDTLVAFSLMDCGRPGDTPEGAAALDRFFEANRTRLHSYDATRGDPHNADYRIPYPVLLAALDLRVRDIDIRYSYPNRRFDRFDGEGPVRPKAANVMQLGYLPYRSGRDYNRANDASLYWNSYFDGSATTDELLVALVLADLATRRSEYGSLFEPQTLTKKYARFVSRHVLDAPFFERMDGFSGWVPLPFPKRLEAVHHRQSFMRKRDGVHAFFDQYRAVCTQLRRDLPAN